MKFADDVDAGLLNIAHDGDDVVLAERLLGAVAHVRRARFDAERQPPDSGAPQLAQHVRLDRIDARVGPDVEVEVLFDQQIANIVDVALVKHEHLVDDLDGLDAVNVMQMGDFGNHRLGPAHAVAVDVKGRVDTAKHALIRTPQRGVNGRIRLP